MQHVDASSRYTIMSITNDELTHRIIIAQDNVERIKTLKIILQDGKTNEYVLKNIVLFKINND